jgi:hypothetical protein
VKRDHFILWLLLGVVAGASITYAFMRDLAPPAAAAQAIRPATVGTAIRDFGIVPINQPEQWLVARDNAGNDLGTLPVAPANLVLRSDKEPELHAPEYTGAPWTITFKP